MKDPLHHSIKKVLIELNPGSGNNLEQVAFGIEWLLNQRSSLQEHSLPSPSEEAKQLRAFAAALREVIRISSTLAREYPNARIVLCNEKERQGLEWRSK